MALPQYEGIGEYVLGYGLNGLPMPQGPDDANAMNYYTQGPGPAE
jgi:hypothetical protein